MADEQGRGERLQIMLTGDELILLDGFRYKRAAVRELLKRGLAAEGFGSAAFGSKSEEYGLSGKTPPGRKPITQCLLLAFVGASIARRAGPGLEALVRD
jgi:hypothetical protein